MCMCEYIYIHIHVTSQGQMGDTGCNSIAWFLKGGEGRKEGKVKVNGDGKEKKGRKERRKE
jgi:hypothetical protein